MKTTCRYCGGIHEVGYECAEKPARKFNKKVSAIDRFRWTNAWKKMTKRIKERDGYM